MSGLDYVPEVDIGELLHCLIGIPHVAIVGLDLPCPSVDLLYVPVLIAFGELRSAAEYQIYCDVLLVINDIKATLNSAGDV